ncbi:MAG: DUF2510 domain-containing protein, partial [Acidimicrobiia bacterium]|nr:DUF2510 domain-containing protein [Acidimicrobiia bacterium]
MSSDATPSPSPASGWYPDPLDAGVERLWDGERWSEQTRAAGSGSMPPPLPPRRPAAPGPPAIEPKRNRSGTGWSTGSVVGLGCGLLALLSVGGCVVLVGLVPLMAVRSQEVFVDEGFEVAVEVPMTTVVPGPEPMDEFPPVTAGPGVATLGSSTEMVAVLDNGEAAVFGITVEEPVDVTEPVLAAGGPDLEQSEGGVLVGVAATVLLQESAVEPLAVPGLFQWTMVGGATGSTYSPVEAGSAGSAGCELIDV